MALQPAFGACWIQECALGLPKTLKQSPAMCLLVPLVARCNAEPLKLQIGQALVAIYASQG